MSNDLNGSGIKRQNGGLHVPYKWLVPLSAVLLSTLGYSGIDILSTKDAIKEAVNIHEDVDYRQHDIIQKSSDDHEKRLRETEKAMTQVKSTVTDAREDVKEIRTVQNNLVKTVARSEVMIEQLVRNEGMSPPR